jgi:hypothetical protein
MKMPLCKQCSKLDFSEYRIRKQHQDIDLEFHYDRARLKRSYWIDSVPSEYEIGDYGELDREDATLGEASHQSDNVSVYDYTYIPMIYALERKLTIKSGRIT